MNAGGVKVMFHSFLPLGYMHILKNEFVGFVEEGKAQ